MAATSRCAPKDRRISTFNFQPQKGQGKRLRGKSIPLESLTGT
jgi:hypothetical protein